MKRLIITAACILVFTVNLAAAAGERWVLTAQTSDFSVLLHRKSISEDAYVLRWWEKIVDRSKGYLARQCKMTDLGYILVHVAYDIRESVYRYETILYFDKGGDMISATRDEEVLRRTIPGSVLDNTLNQVYSTLRNKK